MKSIEVDWIIHGVIEDNGKVCYHTHGLDKHGLKELELNLSLEQKQAMGLINLIALYLIKNKIVIKDDYFLEKEKVLSCDTYFKKVKGIHGNGEEVIRIIFPDSNMLFPWDEGCNDFFKKQI